MEMKGGSMELWRVSFYSKPKNYYPIVPWQCKKEEVLFFAKDSKDLKLQIKEHLKNNSGNSFYCEHMSVTNTKEAITDEVHGLRKYMEDNQRLDEMFHSLCYEIAATC